MYIGVCTPRIKCMYMYISSGALFCVFERVGWCVFVTQKYHTTTKVNKRNAVYICEKHRNILLFFFYSDSIWSHLITWCQCFGRTCGNLSSTLFSKNKSAAVYWIGINLLTLIPCVKLWYTHLEVFSSLINFHLAVKKKKSVDKGS